MKLYNWFVGVGLVYLIVFTIPIILYNVLGLLVNNRAKKMLIMAIIYVIASYIYPMFFVMNLMTLHNLTNFEMFTHPVGCTRDGCI